MNGPHRQDEVEVQGDATAASSSAPSGELCPAPPADLTRLAQAVAQYKATKEVLVQCAYEEVWRKRAEGESIDLDALCAEFPSVHHRVHGVVTANAFLEGHPSLTQEKEEAFVNSSPPVRRKPGKSPPEAGQTFLSFELLEEMGRGAFARVFLARQTDLGNRTVVVKIVPAAQADSEANILGQLKHPNIGSVFSIHKDKAAGLTALCMPYLANATLEDVTRVVRSTGPLPAKARFILDTVRELHEPVDKSTPPPDEAPVLRRGTFVDGVRWIGAQLADALAFIHDKNILHLDLKPANVLLNRDAVPVLIDFNISADPRQIPDKVGGTPVYMSPEHLRALDVETRAVAAPLDERSDIYSLGIILYLLLTGNHPFAPLPPQPPPQESKFKEFIALLLERQRTEAIKPVDEVNPAVDKGFARLIHRCLAYDAKARPQNAAAIAHALRRGNAAPQRARRWVGRHPWFTATTTLALLTAMVLAAVIWSSRPSPSERHLAAGLDAYKQKHFPEAVKHLHGAIQADPKLAQAYFTRGRAYQQMGASDPLYYSFALADYHEAQKLADDGRIQACIGYCLQRRGHTEAALGSYQKAIDKGFESATVCNNLGFCLLKLGERRRKEALDTLERASRLDPSLQAPYHNRAAHYSDIGLNEVLALEARLKTNAMSEEEKQSKTESCRDRLKDGMEALDMALARGPANPELCYIGARLHATAARLGAGSVPRALEYLTEAVHQGMDSRDFALDISLATLKNEPAFKKLVANPPANPIPLVGRRFVDPISDY